MTTLYPHQQVATVLHHWYGNSSAFKITITIMMYCFLVIFTAITTMLFLELLAIPQLATACIACMFLTGVTALICHILSEEHTYG